MSERKQVYSIMLYTKISLGQKLYKEIPSKQCEFCNYLYDKSWISQGCQSGSIGQSGSGGPGGPGGPDGPGDPGGPGGQGCLGGQGGPGDQ